MSTAAAIGPTGPRVHQPRGGGARLTRTLVIVAGVVIAAALLVMIVALHSDSPDSSPTARSDDAARRHIQRGTCSRRGTGSEGQAAEAC